MTVPWVMLALAFAAGLAVGAAYLGVLWLSVRHLSGGGTRAFVAGALARAALVVGAVAVALAAGAGPLPLLAGLAGFAVARTVATRAVRNATQEE
ncbi:N-ATPase subunit AtpR [Roseovarius salinarum]|uniref:N-ATPase subunit AtpR n=1 Tax=Roseovarius salinarum TaxID=1981892 RepID=UPI000C322B4D|nr:ATP synthase subunit I [Roseovarius salinarum]